jgi:hypothetical protein
MESWASAIKRFIIAVILAAVNAIPLGLLGLIVLLRTGSPGSITPLPPIIIPGQPPHPTAGPPPSGADLPNSLTSLLAALAVVAVMFLLTLLALWILSKIGGPLKAEVTASIQKFGGKIWITAAGLVGAFLAIFIAGVGSVYFLSK